MCKNNHASRWIRLGQHSFHFLRLLAPPVARPWMWAHYASCPNTKRLLNPRPSLPTIAFESLIKVKFICKLHKLFTLWYDSRLEMFFEKIRLFWKKRRKFVKSTVQSLFWSISISSLYKLTKLTKYKLNIWLSEFNEIH